MVFQEIRILKDVVKNLEEELMKEKAKHQRAAAKRRKEYQDLMEEVRLIPSWKKNFMKLNVAFTLAFY